VTEKDFQSHKNNVRNYTFVLSLSHFAMWQCQLALE
jgi:hypothetical protein